MSETALSIGEVASRARRSVSAIRFYERNGLLPQAERVHGQRRFPVETLRRLEIIETAKAAGFSLGEIRQLLAAVDEGLPLSEPLQALAARKLPEAEELVASAGRMRDWLTAASACGCDSLETCALFADGA